MTKINFTKSALEALLPAAKEYWVTDTKTEGLFLCVNPKGSKTFFFYKKVKCTPRRIRLGRLGHLSVENARMEAKKLLGQYAQGLSPHQDRKRSQKEQTLNEMFERYYKNHCCHHLKRPEFVLMMYNKHIRGPLGDFPLSTVKRRDIRELHTAMTENAGAAAANRVLDIIRPIFNFAIAEEYLTGHNPATMIRKNRMTSRERFLDDDELSRFFIALAEEKNPDFSDLFTLLFLTGARKRTVLSMRWKDVNLETRVWTVNGDQTKNGRTNMMIIPPKGIEILEQRKQGQKNALKLRRVAKPSDFVFPGVGKAGCLHDPKKSWYRIKARMKVPDIRIHDLRRTLASHMAMSGVPLTVISKALNHRSINVTSIYARLSDNSVKAAIDMVAEKTFARQAEIPKKNAVTWTMSYQAAVPRDYQ